MENDAKAIIEAARLFSGVETFGVQRGTAEEVSIAAVPQGRALVDLKPYLDKYLPAPERRKGTATVTTLQSFISLVNRFKDQESAIFADNSDRPSLLAMLDYNPSEPAQDAVAGVGVSPGAARFGEHRVLYSFPLSAEWLAWKGRSGEGMDMGSFAQFLEDRIMEVLDPADAGQIAKDFADQLNVSLATPQRLMELSRNLSIRVGQKASQGVNLSSGEGRVSFEETHEGEGGALNIPGAFVIGIPVFKNGTIFQLPVRLRYRVDKSGGVVWTINLQRIDKLWEAVIEEACQQVIAETSLPLFYGAPEK